MAVLSVDATHNNPVLNVFIYLLSLEVQAKAQSTLRQELQHSSGKHKYCIFSVIIFILNSFIGYY